MDFIKNHKKLIVLIIILLIFLIIGIMSYIFLKKFFYSDTKEDNYGRRLDGIESVQIDNKKVDEIKKELSENTNVNSVKYHIEGKIVNFIIDVKPEMKIDEAKKLSDIVIKLYSDEQKTFYDTQIYLVSKDEVREENKSSTYPIIGYRHKTNIKFVWTK